MSSEDRKSVWYSFDNFVRLILNIFVLIAGLLLLIVFFIGSYDYIKNIEKNKCQMTYMYEFPQYVKLSIDTERDKKYPMFGLYIYAEGKHIHAARELKFTGIPVLFLPGNAGSYKQVRSFASVALRKWLDNRTPYHFDFFTIDFNEELSGLYGYALDKQTEYTRLAIEKIMSFYEEYQQVAVIGHSMGGIIAKWINENERLVHLIFALATPHWHAALILDPEIDFYYYKVGQKWEKEKLLLNEGEGVDEQNVTLVTISGGDRDILVQEKLTIWPYNDLHISTTRIPGCWASTDHLAIVWCKQVVMAVVRSLFDLVELRKRNNYYAITENSELKSSILNYHLFKKTSGKSYHTAHLESQSRVDTPQNSNWKELIVKNYCAPKSGQTTFIMFPKEIIKESVKGGDPEDYKVLIWTTNTNAKNWIFGCISQTIENGIRYCSKMENLSKYGDIIPSFHRRKKVAHLDYSLVSKYQNLVIKMEPVPYQTCVYLQIYQNGNNLPAIQDFETENRIFYNFTEPFRSFRSKLIAWKITATTIEDENKKCTNDHNSVGIVRQGNFGIHKFFKNESLIVRINDWRQKSANILLYLEPSCKYFISMEMAPLETAGQIFKTFCRLLPSYFTSIIFMSLFFQKDPTSWKNPIRILLSNGYYLTVLPGFVISTLVWLIPNDYPEMMEGADFSPFIPLICYLVSYSILLTFVSILWVLIITAGNTLYGIATKILKKKILSSVPDELTNYAIEVTFFKIPLTLAVVLIALSLSTCGTLSLAIAFLFNILKVFKMYQDILEDIVRGRINKVSESLSSVNFHIMIALLLFLLSVLNFPSLIHWVKNFGYGQIPQWDLSIYIALMALPTIAVLWQDYVPKLEPTMWIIHRYLFYFMSLSVVIWGTHRLYFLAFVITLMLVSLATCQFVSKVLEVQQNLQRQNAENATNANQHQQQQQGNTPEEESSTQQNEQNEDLLASSCSSQSEDQEESSSKEEEEGEEAEDLNKNSKNEEKEKNNDLISKDITVSKKEDTEAEDEIKEKPSSRKASFSEKTSTSTEIFY